MYLFLATLTSILFAAISTYICRPQNTAADRAKCTVLFVTWALKTTKAFTSILL